MKGKIHIADIPGDIIEIKRAQVWFLGIRTNYITPEQLEELTDILKIWRSGAQAIAYLGVTRQRLAVLMKTYGFSPKRFGARIFYWKVKDLQAVKEMIRVEYRKN